MKPPMKLHNKYPLLILSILLLAANSMAARKPLDRIAAIVNSDVILYSEFDARLQQVTANARESKMALPDKEVLNSQIMDVLISEQLQLDMARKNNFSVSDEQVNFAISNILKSNNMSQQQLEYELRKEGMDMLSFREKIRRDITIQQIQQGAVQQRIQISPLEVDNFLQSAEAKFWISPEYHLGHILISLPQAADANAIEEAKQKALALVKNARDGKSFAELAIANSDGPAALKGGDLGWRKTSSLPTLFAEIVPQLKVGAVSEPARSPAGFHVLKLYEKRGDEQQTQEQVNARHILIKPSAILSNDEAREKLKEIRQKILDGADFAAEAKEHSEDIGSMLAGGDLGWGVPELYVPEFAQVIKTSPIGEISEPFQTQFGWHILQVQERRNEDITDAVLRDKAARILTNRRFEDELQIWLREMRDAAYVDIRI